MGSVLDRLGCDRGSVAITFAAVLLVLVAACGGALDYASAYRGKSKLDTAAEAAVLAAVKAAQERFVAGDAGWQTVAAAAGVASFTQNRNGLSSAIQTGNPTVTVQRVNNEFTGSIAYSATYTTSFMRLFGQPSINLSRSINSKVSIVNYLDVHLLIDASPSMGIGATLADQTTLQNATGCALVCHATGGNYAAGRATGAVLRIDFVRNAVRKFIADMQAKTKTSDQVRLSIHLFSNDLAEILAPTTDLAAAYAAAAGIDLLPPPAFGSNSTYALSRLNGSIVPGGQGYTVNSRKSFVVLLSDGVEDARYQPDPSIAESIDPNFVNTSPQYNVGNTELLQSMERTACDPLKSNNHTLMTAHVEYLIPPAWNAPAVPRFDFIRDNVTPKSLVEFQACASAPSLAYTAAASSDIAPMFQQILDDIMLASNLRLSN